MKNLMMIIIIFLPLFGVAQQPTINWEKVDGASRNEIPYQVIQLADSSYLIVGWVNNFILNGGNKTSKKYDKTYTDGWVVKRDKNGNKLWDKSYGGNRQDQLTDAIAIPSGGALLFGYSISKSNTGNKTAPNQGSYDYWLIRIDNDGNIIWQKSYGGRKADFGTSIVESADGNYFLAGYSQSSIEGDKSEKPKGGYDYWIIKIDPYGKKIWDRTIGGNDHDYVSKIIGNATGGCTITGSSFSSASSDKSEPAINGYDDWVVRLDFKGNVLWENTIQSLNNFNYNSSIAELNGDIYLLSAGIGTIGYDKTVENARKWDLWMIQLDGSNGNSKMQKLYGGITEEFASDIIVSSDNNLLIKGYSSSGISGDKTESLRGGIDLWLLKIDQSGNIIWDKTVGGPSKETPTNFDKGITSDQYGNIVVSTRSFAFKNSGGDKSFQGYNQDDYWTIQLKENIVDNTPPFVKTKDITVELDVEGNASITAQDIDDGTSDPGGIAVLEIDISNFDCSNIGPNTVILTATDNSGNTASAPAIVTVVDNIPPTVITKNITLNLDATGNAYLEAIHLDNGTTDACGIALFQSKENFTCADIGENIINLAVTDVNGNTAKGQAIVTIINDNPVINSLSLPINPNPLETQMNASATFTDDNLSAAEFSWGDGSSSIGSILDNNITASHIYSTPGVYEVSLTITDACGLEATKMFQYVVIYDAYGGFVTGGGYIWSHPGYYTPDPLAEGKANFGFVAKYQKGATTPTGNTQFRFTAGNMNFHSAEYDWLVIAGQKAMYKGTGTINGAGSYKFMLSAIDGTTKADGDRFRMQIWDMSDNLIYDNQLGKDENADASTYLGGGSITIHDGKTKGGTSTAEVIAGDFITESIKFYPNPVKSTLNIQLTERFKEGNNPMKIEIFETNGRSVGFRKYSEVSSGKIQVQLESLNNGIYILTLKKGNYLEYLRFIKE
ncbi:T9SS type A sorting domain-containing protein [Mangrovivirga cuniculi]|uniref:PKD domain-containing protein n=1 Tax=Mangrovivirga cuniculi TaxID=2715131 RepID=A0A4D7JQM8_9BACT|nr:T9SS type A sorting domain-containing protein [Mangrovivirga cuniculi]QCK13295.1 hypothetical protein DCC35_00290 [Mangrovivirga cuniculi]